MEYRPYYLAREWVKNGHNVRIVAASESHLRQQKPSLNGKITFENIEDIDYVWLKTPSYNENGINRVINLLSFAKSLFFWHKLFLSDFTPDLVIASSPHPFIIRGAKRIANLNKAKLIFEVRDLWPLTLIELGGMKPSHPFVALMQMEEKYAYKHSDYVVSLLPNAIEHMKLYGMSANKFIYIPNGVQLDDWNNTTTPLLKGIDEHLNKLRQEFDLLIGFAGTHGVANALNYLVDAASLLTKESIGFVLIGYGTEKNNLKRQVKEKKLHNVFFIDPVRKNMIPSFLNQMDILYLGWNKSPIYRFGISANKIFEYMMAAKPIVHSVEAGNDPVAESGCGISCKAENAKDIAKAIIRLKNMSEEERKAMGTKGKEYVTRNHDYKKLAEQFIDAI